MDNTEQRREAKTTQHNTRPSAGRALSELLNELPGYPPEDGDTFIENLLREDEKND